MFLPLFLLLVSWLVLSNPSPCENNYWKKNGGGGKKTALKCFYGKYEM